MADLDCLILSLAGGIFAALLPNNTKAVCIIGVEALPEWPVGSSGNPYVQGVIG